MKYFYAAGLAMLSWLALGLQLYLSVHQSVANGAGAWHGVWMYLAFFTICTNLLVALTLTVPLLGPHSSAGRFFSRPGVVTAAAAYIAMVGIIYNVLLSHLWQPQGLRFVADVLLHDVVPVLFLVYWAGTVSRGAVRWSGIASWCTYPIAYFAYAMLRGALTHFYPYPFIDVGHLGYARVLANAIGMLVGFILIAALLVAFKNFGTSRQPVKACS